MIVTLLHAVDLGQSIWIIATAADSALTLSFDAVYTVEPDTSKADAIDRSIAAFIADHAQRVARAFVVDVGKVEQAFAAYESRYVS